MFISPGELERGQWIIAHSNIEKQEENASPVDAEPMGLFGMVLTQAANYNKIQPVPHLVLAVQLPFVVVLDVTQDTLFTKIWRTDETRFVEVSKTFVQSYNLKGWEAAMAELKTKRSKTHPLP